MNRPMVALGVAAAALTLGACSSTDNAGTTAPSHGTSSSVAVTPTTIGPLPSATSPAVPSSGASAQALAASCRAAVVDQRGALAQLQTYVKNPLKGGVTANDVDQTRQRLQTDERKAPAPLREELRTQVGVLDQAVQGIRTKNIKKVDIAALQAAQARVAAICASATK